MPDNLTGTEGAPPPPLPNPNGGSEETSPVSSASENKPPAPRVVVTLSSVAKTPPAGLPALGQVVAPPRQVPSGNSPRRPILPAKEAAAAAQRRLSIPRQPQLNRTMQVKLPPKSGVLPQLTSLASMPLAPASKPEDSLLSPPEPPPAAPPIHHATPPPLPLVTSEDSFLLPSASPPPLPEVEKMATPPPVLSSPEPAASTEEAPKLPPPVRLKSFPLGESEDSIFPDPPPSPNATGWKHLEPGELLPPPQEGHHAHPEDLLPPLLPHGKPAVLLAPPVEPAKVAPPPLAVVPPLTGIDHPESHEKLRLPPPLQPPTKIEAPVAEAKAPASLPNDVPPLVPTPGIPAAKRALPPPLPGSMGKAIPPAAVPLPLPIPPPPVGKREPETQVDQEKKSSDAPSLFDLPSTTPEVSTPPEDKKSAPLPKIGGIASTALSTSRLREIGSKTPSPAQNPSATLPTGATTEPPPPINAGTVSRPVPAGKAPAATPPVAAGIPVKTAATRAARVRKRRLVSTIIFYVLLVGVVAPLLFFLGIHFGSETRVEGQIIPPSGTLLANEVWIVSDFRELASGIADDLAAERAPKLQEIQERQDHVQRAQADIAAREERIRLLNEQVQAAKDEINSTIKQAHDAAQKIWDGPGAALEDEYKSHLEQLRQTIAARAKALNLAYQPDDTYQSPEVWANAYRLALYQTPPGVDGVKEHQWIEDQLKAWRAFTTSYDDRKDKLRQDAAKIQLSPTPVVTDLNSKMEDLQHRVDSTVSEEDPIKMELAQAQTDLAQAQTEEAGLDAKYYQELDALPESSITKRLPVTFNGRFSWRHLEKDSAFSAEERTHSYWLFARSVRPDGRQYWVLSHFTIGENSTLPILIEPASFLSTKTILRPDLSADEQQQ